MRGNCMAFLAALILGASHVRAEMPIVTIDTVIVTAERFPVKEKESSRFVKVVSSEELRETGANNLVDALKRTGGFAYKAFGPMGISHGGMNSTLSIRGIGGGELVLVNGVPVQGASWHSYDLNTIPVDQIERVEVLKGAASTLYGADAMSGVINIITKRPPKGMRIEGSVELGEELYNNHSLSLSLRGISIGFNYQHLGERHGISRSFSKGYYYNLENTDKYSWNLDVNITENFRLDYLGSYYDTGFEKHFEEGKPYRGTDQDHYKHFVDLIYETSTFKAKAFANYDEMRRREYTDPSKPETKRKNYNFGLVGMYRFGISDWQFDVGTEWVYRGADYRAKIGCHRRNDYALFLQAKRSFRGRLTATLGIRGQLIDGEPGTRDYSRFLPSFGLTFKAMDELNLFANAGKAFRAPTFGNMYYESSFLVGNPKLKPEEGWTYEIGGKYDDEFLRLRLAGFYMTYRDKIEIDRSRGYPLTYFNSGTYESKGVEWESRGTPFIRRSGWIQNISLYTAGYWAEPTAEDPSGKEYQSGPKFQATLGVQYLTHPLLLDLNCQILTSRERNLDGYSVLNFYGRCRLWKGYFTLSVDNVFDEEVQVSGDLRDNAPNRYLYYSIGRLAKVGYRVEF